MNRLTDDQITRAIEQAPDPATNDTDWEYWMEETKRGWYIRWYPDVFGEDFCRAIACMKDVLSELHTLRKENVRLKDERKRLKLVAIEAYDFAHSSHYGKADPSAFLRAYNAISDVWADGPYGGSDD